MFSLQTKYQPADFGVFYIVTAGTARVRGPTTMWLHLNISSQLTAIRGGYGNLDIRDVCMRLLIFDDTGEHRRWRHLTRRIQHDTMHALPLLGGLLRNVSADYYLAEYARVSGPSLDTLPLKPMPLITLLRRSIRVNDRVDVGEIGKAIIC